MISNDELMALQDDYERKGLSLDWLAYYTLGQNTDLGAGRSSSMVALARSQGWVTIPAGTLSWDGRRYLWAGSDDYDLAQLAYELACTVNEATHYNYLEAEFLRISCEAMMNGHVTREILAEAEREVSELREALGQRE